MTHYLHHGTMFSYYSAKTRAYLSYKQLPFRESMLGTDSRRFQEVTGKAMIPVVETADGEILQDTTVIIDELERRHPDRAVIPDDPVLLLVSRIVEFVTDEFWIFTAMNSRWHDPASKAFAMSEMSRVIGGGMGLAGDAANVVGETVAGKMQAYLPHLGIGTAEGREAAGRYFESVTLALNKLVGPDSAHTCRYVLGARPSLIDICLFTAYYAHQYRDAGDAGNFIKTRAPDLAYYLDTLHAAQCANDSGELTLNNDAIEGLKLLTRPAATFAENIARETAILASHATPGQRFEKTIAPFTFDLNGQPFSRGASTFSAWKLQRVQDVYHDMHDDQQSEALSITEKLGWDKLLGVTPAYRLERKDYRTFLI